MDDVGRIDRGSAETTSAAKWLRVLWIGLFDRLPKFQVVIPRDVRESIGLKAGEVLQVIQYGRRIEMIPVTSIKSMKGFLKGMCTAFDRDEER